MNYAVYLRGIIQHRFHCPLNKSENMPSIAHFRGITIYIYAERDAPHRLPHFHVYYGEYLASFSIDPPELLEGWHQVQAGRRPNKIQGI